MAKIAPKVRTTVPGSLPKTMRRKRSTLRERRPVRGGRQGGRVSGCKDPEARASLLPYALSTCGDEEAFEFEVHLLGCVACFRDLRCLGRVGTLLRDLMASSSPALDRMRSVLRGGSPVGDGAARPRSAPGVREPAAGGPSRDP